MSEKFIKQMADVGIVIPPASDNTTVLTKLTPDFMRQLAMVYSELDTKLHVESTKTISLASFTLHAGRTYAMCSVDNDSACITVPNSETGQIIHVPFPLDAVSQVFHSRVPAYVLGAIKGLIMDKHAMRFNELQKIATRFLSNTEPFAVGDVIRWKSGLCNYDRPMEDELAIVLECLKEPVCIATDLKSSEAGARNDIIVGVIDDDGELLHYIMDSRRFEKVEKV